MKTNELEKLQQEAMSQLQKSRQSAQIKEYIKIECDKNSQDEIMDGVYNLLNLLEEDNLMQVMEDIYNTFNKKEEQNPETEV